jgi:hypothetical protein
MATKKETASKKINIKNKKEATKVLANKTPSKPKKAPTKKKATVKKETKKSTTSKTTLENENLIISEENKKVTNSTKKATEKKEKDKEKKETKKEAKKETKKVKKNDTPNIKRKITKKEPEKTKLVIPKEWQEISKNVKKEKETEAPSNKIKGKLRSSIFEEVDEKTYLLKKQKEKDNIKKTFLIILIIVVTVLLGIYIFFKFNDNLRKQLEKYESFIIGTKVELKDGSIWYVVNDSKVHDESVKLVKATVIDINGDNKIDTKDAMKYNSKGESVYDPKNENSAAKYLNETYKKELEEKVGPISEISLLTSKEYVRIREKLEFGYEWTTGNWLAGSSVGYWWVISSPRDDSVYVVTYTGTYKLVAANSISFVRPTIVIRKALVTKLEEPTKKDKSDGELLIDKSKELFKSEK